LQHQYPVHDSAQSYRSSGDSAPMHAPTRHFRPAPVLGYTSARLPGRLLFLTCLLHISAPMPQVDTRAGASPLTDQRASCPVPLLGDHRSALRRAAINPARWGCHRDLHLLRGRVFRIRKAPLTKGDQVWMSWVIRLISAHVARAIFRTVVATEGSALSVDSAGPCREHRKPIAHLACLSIDV